MQIKYFSNFLMGLIFLVFVIINSNCSYNLSRNSFAQVETKDNLNCPNLNSNLNNQDESVPSYNVLLGNDCIKKKKCHVLLVIEEKYFNKKDELVSKVVEIEKR